jgi:excisionase family DNA binding protein
MSDASPSPWLTVAEAAARAKVGPKIIYRAVKRRELRAAIIGSGRTLRLRIDHVDSWLEQSSTPVEVVPGRA